MTYPFGPRKPLVGPTKKPDTYVAKPPSKPGYSGGGKVPPVKNPSLGVLLSTPHPGVGGRNIEQPPPRSGFNIPGAQGLNFGQDLNAINQAIAAKEAEIQDYLYANGLSWEANGIFDANGRPDGYGANLISQLYSLQDAYGRLYDSYDAGLYDQQGGGGGYGGGGGGGGGFGAASAFIDTEMMKAQEAERAYDDYVQRVEDTANIESLGLPRAEVISRAFDSAQDSQAQRQDYINKGLLGDFAPMKSFVFPGAGIDYTQYAKQVQGTIPSQAPAFDPYDVDAAAAAERAHYGGYGGYGGGGGISQAYQAPPPAPDANGWVFPPGTLDLSGSNLGKPGPSNPTGAWPFIPTTTPTPDERGTPINLGPAGMTPQQKLDEWMRWKMEQIGI